MLKTLNNITEKISTLNNLNNNRLNIADTVDKNKIGNTNIKKSSINISVEKLNFAYKNKPILKNINILFEPAKITGILGANGSGKSTLLKNIINYLKPNKGVVNLNFKNIKEYSNKELAKIFGFVPQKSELQVPMTAREVIYMGKVARLKNSFMSFSKEDHEDVENIIENLKLSHLANNSILTLSGGEFQKVLLARALAQSPEVLLLDESTSALDVQHSLEIIKTIEDLVKQKKVTCIMILHDLNLAGMYCDNIIFLKDGSIKYVGTTKELFNMEILKEIYGFKCRVMDNNGYPCVLPTKL